jgi:sec-independent protein translocase protein TatC
LITPPDITSMLMLGIPMCLLYELGMLAVRWLVKPGSLRRDLTNSRRQSPGFH